MIKARKKYYALTGIGIFAVLIISICVYILIPRSKPALPRNPDMFLEIARDGDIICRLGDRFWSVLFRDMSAEDRRFSHMGIIRVNNGRVNVIHSEGTTKPEKDFVKEESIGDFVKIARAVGVYRINNLEDQSRIANLAAEYLNLPFDWRFDMGDDSKIYCTELLYVILKRIMPQVELPTVFVKELGKDIVPLDAISNSDYFSEIYFIDNEKTDLTR
jgi:hypothetical protein